MLKLKKNNLGSSMVMTLVAIGFVTILGTVILSAAVTNHKLRSIETKAKKVFYNADGVVDELYSAVGKDCYADLEAAYNKVLANLDTYVSNDSANKKIRSLFYDSLSSKFTPNQTSSVEAYLYERLGLAADNGSIIIKVGSGEENIDRSVSLKDITVQYYDPTQDYYSSITFDLELSYPDATFHLTNRGDFKNYAMIALTSANFGGAASSLKGSAYAGNFVVESGTTATVNSSNALIIADILRQDANSVLNVSASDVWARNIALVGDNAKLTTSDTDMFVYDDLTLSGKSDNVSLSGTYMGYSYNGDKKDSADTSSAIIINGKQATVDLSGLTELIVAGKAYISLGDSASSYYVPTGESLGIKSAQQIYFVPDDYIDRADIYDVSGWTTALVSEYGIGETVTEGVTTYNISNSGKFDNFFAMRYGFLNTSSPLNSNGTLNFASDTSKQQYKMCILYASKMEAYERSYRGISLDPEYTPTTEEQANIDVALNARKEFLDLYMEDFFPYELGLLDSDSPFYNGEGQTEVANPYFMHFRLNYDDSEIVAATLGTSPGEDYVHCLIEESYLTTLANNVLGAVSTDKLERFQVIRELLMNIFTNSLEYTDVSGIDVGDNSASGSAKIYTKGALYTIDPSGAYSYIANNYGYITGTARFNLAMSRFSTLKTQLYDPGATGGISVDANDIQAGGTLDLNTILAEVLPTSNADSVYRESVKNPGLIGVVAYNDYTIEAGKTGGLVISSGDVYVNSDFAGLIIAQGTIYNNGHSIESNVANVNAVLSEFEDVKKYIVAYDSGEEFELEDIAEMTNWRKNYEKVD